LCPQSRPSFQTTAPTSEPSRSKPENKKLFKGDKESMHVASIKIVSTDREKSGINSFNVVPVMWPAMGAETAFLGGADGLFIPANAKDKDASVEVLKAYLGEKIQTIHADAGFAIANVNVKVSDPVISSLSEMNSYIISKEFFNISPKMKDYADKQLIAEFILGKSLDEVLGELEKIRLEAINQ
jgi:hypothetical protein